jgi:DNA-binding transcriptional regulator YiaG
MSIEPQISPAQLRTALDKLDVGQTDLARTVGASTSTAQRWVKEDGNVPGPVALIVKLLLLRPELKDVIGLARASTRGRKPAKGKRSK